MSAQYAQALRTVTVDSAATGGYTTALLDEGSSSKPVYFSNGVPIECGASLAVSITGNAVSANKVNHKLYFGVGDSDDNPLNLTFDGSENSYLTLIAGTNISITRENDGDFPIGSTMSSGGIAGFVINNTYSLPTASSTTLGGVKTGAAITDTTGYTACAIKNGVIYYKDTNSTYTLSGLGGIGTISASGTAPLTLSATKSGTSVTMTGSVATATNSSLGVVTTNSTVTSTTDLIACPIINGIVYYKDTNTTYTSLKNPSSLTLKVNSSSSALYTYDGSAAKTLNIIAGSNVSVTGTTAGNITIAATDTTYSAATASAAGLMSASDKSKLDAITASADAVSFSASLTSGTQIGTITINGTATKIYCQTNTNTTYSAGTGISLSGTTFSNSGVRSIATGSTNGTISVNTNGTSANVAVKGLGSNAYTSTAYLPLTGGTLSGAVNGTAFWANQATGENQVGVGYKDGSLYFWGNKSSGTAGIWDSGSEAYIMQRNTSTGGYTIYGESVYGAVWNDYAEFRATKEEIEAGRVVVENGDDTLSLATERLMPGANVVSDTFGFAIGETEISKTPLAVSGRALVYTYEDRGSYKPGDPVCSGPNGTVSKMTRKEVMQYPDRMIGTVSAIPNYDTWGTGNVEVNGRIWIKIL